MAKRTKERELRQLQQRHKDAIEFLVMGDMPEYLVADKIGVNPATLSNWKRSPLFREALEKRVKEEEMWRRLKYRAQANRAAERLAELVESKHPTTAIAAVREMLRLAGDGVSDEKQTEAPQVGIVILPEIKK